MKHQCYFCGARCHEDEHIFCCDIYVCMDCNVGTYAGIDHRPADHILEVA